MRLTISALLLVASAAAVPAMAQDQPQGWHQNGGDRGGDRGGREGRGNDGRGGAVQPAQAPTRPQAQAQPQAQRPNFQRPDRPQAGPGGDRGGAFPQRGNAPDGGHRVYGRPDNGVQVWRNDRGTAPRQDWSNRPNDRPGGWDRDRDGRPDGNRPGNWNGDRRDGNRGGWNNGWRNDSRYDWRGWRSAHRDNYRVGRYRPPSGYGWGYRRWGIGVRIAPVFFAQDYWIDNPDYYRLPPAYGSYRWVRYYNDALLVDIYSGTVVDEIPDFFW